MPMVVIHHSGRSFSAAPAQAVVDSAEQLEFESCDSKLSFAALVVIADLTN